MVDVSSRAAPNVRSRAILRPGQVSRHVGAHAAKSVFQVHAINTAGEVDVGRALTRAQVLPFSPHKTTVCEGMAG
jgi:hypothetical protein